MDGNSFSDAQARADVVAQAFGKHDSAPRALQGESLKDYRTRLATKYKTHSPDWKAADLYRLPEEALRVAEAQIYKDALHVATHPSNEPGAPLRSRSYIGPSGHRITEFSGDPVMVWAPFLGAGVRYLVGVNRKPAGARND